MSYNILLGAGIDPYWEQKAARDGFAGNRLSEILAIIKAANPDILGIQEANDWDRGTPSIAQQVANELGMNYFLARSLRSRYHIVLFTKFKIVEAGDEIGNSGTHGALRATLSTPGGQIIHVLVVHLDPLSSATRVREIDILMKEASSYYTQSPTILMGDMNFTDFCDLESCAEYYRLSRAGWRLVMKGEGNSERDQIWTSPFLSEPVREMFSSSEFVRASDHDPVGAIIGIDSPQGEQ